MLTLLSPAKNLDLEPANIALPITQPVFPSDTKQLAQLAKKLSANDLSDLMHISPSLAELNVERFKSFNVDGQSNSAKPAALTFDGDVYRGLDAPSLNNETLAYAQDNLRILSGLYGVLKPMDAMQPYRLEMGTRLENPRGINLYKFWGRKISDQLMADMDSHASKVIVNLASIEYFKAVDKKAVTVPIIEAKFLNVKDGEAKNISFYAKKARGLMARWIMENRIDAPDDLSGFNLEGYQFVKSKSSESQLVFSRKQPPPAGS